MTWKMSRLIRMAGTALGVILAAVGINHLSSWGGWCVGVGLVILLLTGLQSLCFEACPHCGWPLGRRSPFASYCPKCGKKLE